MTTIEIATRDGRCPAHVFRPSGAGRWPAVLVYMDGIGIRPAMLEVGERIATFGYWVLVPDLFYRSGPYEPMDAQTVFSDPEKRKVLMSKFFAHATTANVMSDTGAFLDCIAGQADVKPGPIGTTGYCMGGVMSLAAAGTYPDRICATGVYHAGRLATDDPQSPHLLADRIRSRVYIVRASDDPSFPDDMKARLEDALTKAGVDHTIELSPGRHGFVLRDTPTYDRAASERHYETLRALLDAKLKA